MPQLIKQSIGYLKLFYPQLGELFGCGHLGWVEGIIWKKSKKIKASLANVLTIFFLLEQRKEQLTGTGAHFQASPVLLARHQPAGSRWDGGGGEHPQRPKGCILAARNHVYHSRHQFRYWISKIATLPQHRVKGGRVPREMRWTDLMAGHGKTIFDPTTKHYRGFLRLASILIREWTKYGGFLRKPALKKLRNRRTRIRFEKIRFVKENSRLGRRRTSTHCYWRTSLHQIHIRYTFTDAIVRRNKNWKKKLEEKRVGKNLFISHVRCSTPEWATNISCFFSL